MPPDNSFQNALFQMVQRIEDKLDNVKDDISTVKAKQASIETALEDHIANSPSTEKSGMDTAKDIIFRYALPISLALLMLGRASVGIAGNSPSLNANKAPQTTGKVIQDDTFVARNERMDSILREQLKKQVGIQ